MNLSLKQTEAFDKLTGTEYIHLTEILYGGAAGGGKSYLGVCWLVYMALTHNRTRWFMGRKTLKDLKQSTLVTFFDLCRNAGIWYKYTQAPSPIITLENNSQILLMGLDYRPSDPEFSRFGSLELTGGFIDEVDQIEEKAFTIIKTRVGRYMNEQNGLVGKVLASCNPRKNWVFDYWVKPYMAGEIEPHRDFIQSLHSDNPHLPSQYIENLSRTDKLTRARLLEGDWNYLDNEHRWAFSFDRNKHCKKGLTLNKSEIVYLSFDFNRNPIVCVVVQHYDNIMRVINVIDVDNCTTQRLCEIIATEYKGCYFRVTGDASGKNTTTLSNLHNFDIIKYSLDLNQSQMEYSGSNPPLHLSRSVINQVLERYPLEIDEDRCSLLVRDFETVKSDSEGKPIKANRRDLSQRADCLDAFRYVVHRYLKHIIKYIE